MPQESLQAWDAPCENSSYSSEEADIKDKELLIRLFNSYKLSFTVPGVRNSNTDVSRICSQIERSLKALDNATRSDKWLEHQKSLKEDLHVLTEKIISLLSIHTVENLDGSSRERNARFLHVISRLDRFGKRPVGNIMSSITRDIEKLDLRILEDYRYGSYGLRQELDRQLSAPNASADRISKLIGQLQAYRLFRDAARWLGDGAFPWARPWARSRSRAFVALFIDEN